MSIIRTLRQLTGVLRIWLALVATTSLVAAQANDGAIDGARATSPTTSAAMQTPPADAPRPLGETLTGDAKRDYEAAILLHKSGDLAGAQRRFISAYDAAKDVRLLWNAAVCEQGLRHYAKAIVLVRRYLSSHSPLITADSEDKARVFLDAALPLTARLVVEVDETGADAYLDGEALGALPLDRETRVDFGTHGLVVRKPRFTEALQTFTVTSSADVRVAIRLDAVTHRGRLVVRAGKSDAITIDGRLRAFGTFDGALASGPHRLRVTATNYRPYEATVVIEDDHSRALDLSLTRARGQGGLPTWVWLVGGAAMLTGAGTAAYLILRSPQTESTALPSGSAGSVQLPLR